jgi:RimJ/RimL family protein N-acetyltransferase
MQEHLFHIDTAVVTPHLVVRRFREREGLAFWELIQDNQSYIGDYLPELLEQIRAPEEAEGFVRRKLARWLLQQEFAFSIWETNEAKPIGYLVFADFQPELGSARLSGFLDRPYTGRGLMTEVVVHMLPFAFRQLGLQRLYALTYADHYAAQRLARKCGFHREGDLRLALRRPTGDYSDATLFALTGQEYLKT